MEQVVAELKGAVVLLDEASQVGTRDMERLVRLANIVEVTRLVLVVDTRQLGAVDAGKPFERSQQAGHATAHLTDNLRSRSEQMKTVTAALEQGDVASAFDVLRSATVEVTRDQIPLTAARMWAALPTAERESTLLLASGRAMRSAANAAARSELKLAGELSGPAMTLTVLDRVTVTREGARQDLTTLRVPVEPRGPDLPFPEKDIGLEPSSWLQGNDAAQPGRRGERVSHLVIRVLAADE